MIPFAMTGVAGYIAPRHLQAIKETGNRLVAAVDPHDSVGILDSYFPDASFFTEFERFDRHIEKLRRSSEQEAVRYISICAPNHLHDAHVRLALRAGAGAICEKPLVLFPSNLDQLELLEEEYGGTINTVLQLRTHPALIALRERIHRKAHHLHNVQLTYITSRGRWYAYSWKGDERKSGGIAMNIGIHFFDLLIWLFGTVRRSIVHVSDPRRMSGVLELQRAEVQWFLSIDAADLPTEEYGRAATYRSITIDDEEVEFSNGFRDLHTEVYRRILDHRGFGIADARPSIELVHAIRHTPIARYGDVHPFALPYAEPRIRKLAS